jgi:hypothetical protein
MRPVDSVGVMGLVNVRNLKRAKQLLDKNRHRVGDVVGKAGEQLDKASKGKTANVTSKAAEAARKYSAGGIDPVATKRPPAETTTSDAAEHARPDQAQSTAGAATSVKGAADAVTNLLNKAAAKAEAKNAAQR